MQVPKIQNPKAASKTRNQNKRTLNMDPVPGIPKCGFQKRTPKHGIQNVGFKLQTLKHIPKCGLQNEDSNTAGCSGGACGVICGPSAG